MKYLPSAEREGGRDRQAPKRQIFHQLQNEPFQVRSKPFRLSSGPGSLTFTRSQPKTELGGSVPKAQKQARSLRRTPGGNELFPAPP